jgi:hypothetical protein
LWNASLPRLALSFDHERLSVTHVPQLPSKEGLLLKADVLIFGWELMLGRLLHEYCF